MIDISPAVTHYLVLDSERRVLASSGDWTALPHDVLDETPVIGQRIWTDDVTLNAFASGHGESLCRVLAGHQQRVEIERLVTQAGDEHCYRVTLVSTVGPGPVSAVLSIVDVTVSRRLEKEVLQQRMLMEAAQSIAALAVWQLDLSNNRLTWSEKTCQLFGVDPQAFGGTLEELFERVHAEDRERLRAAQADSIRGGQPLDIEYRLVLPSGVKRVVRERGRLFRAPSGTPMYHAGVVMDITEQRNAEQAWRVSEQRFQSLFTQSPNPVYEVSLDGRYLNVNRAFEHLSGYSKAEMRQLSYKKLVAPEYHQINEAQFLRTVAGEKLSYEVECVHKRGHRVRLHITNMPNIVDDCIVGVYGVAEDVTERRALESQLEESRKLLQIAGQVARIGGWSADLETRRLIWSDEVAAIHEAPNGIKLNLDQGIAFYTPEYQPSIRALFDRCITEGTAFDAEMEIVTMQGHRRWVRTIGQAIRNPKGQIINVQGALQDIDKLKFAEVAQQRLQRTFSVTLEAMDEAFFTVDHEWTIIYLNREVEKLVRINRSDVLGCCLWDAFPGLKDSEIGRSYLRAAAQAEPVVLETFYDVGQFWAEVRVYPTADGLSIYFRDISVRRSQQLELLEYNRALALLNHCNEALIRNRLEKALLAEICRITVMLGTYAAAWIGYAEDDPHKTIRMVAEAGPLVAGYADEVGISWSEATELGGGPAGTVIRSGQPQITEDLLVAPHFKPWREAAVRRGFRGQICLPLKDSIRCFGVLVLFTGTPATPSLEELSLLKKLAENLTYGIINIRAQRDRSRLQESVLRVATMASESSSDDFYDMLTAELVKTSEADLGLIFTTNSADPTSLKLLCFTGKSDMADECWNAQDVPWSLTGGPACGVVQTNLATKYPEMVRRLGIQMEGCVWQRLDVQSGHAIGVMAVFFQRPQRNANVALSILQIFSARVAAELSKREANLRIQEQASLLDQAHDAIIVRGLDHVIRYWNRGAERLYGWSSDEALGRSAKVLLYKDATEYENVVDEFKKNGEWVGRITQSRKDGTDIIVEGHSTMMFDDHGRPRSVLSINTDITARVVMEAQLQQAQRLEALGQLTGGVAHDFNNLLTVILGNTQLLSERLADQPRLQRLSDLVNQAALRGADLVRRLLTVSRRQTLTPRVTDVDLLLGNFQELLLRTLGATVTVRFELDSSPWHVLIDPSQLEHALLNLGINARDSMPEGGQLTIASERYTAKHTESSPSLPPGDYVRVSVSDTGIGIAAEDLPRIFDPFFTTKGFGAGTGLGLSTVYGFVKQSSGHIDVQSNLGEGTTISVFLPRCRDAVPDDAVETAIAPRTSMPVINARILVVEDQANVRDFACAVLASAGYRATQVSSAELALSWLESSEDIDLLFSDVVMSGADGYALAEKAQKLRPGLRVLLTSGYVDDQRQNIRGAQSPPLLDKPYSREGLLRSVYELLCPQKVDRILRR